MSGTDERDTSPKGSLLRLPVKKSKRGLLFIGLAALLVLAIVLVPNNQAARTESYKNTSGAAGLNAIITHSNKPVSDVNVYIFKDDGQQVSVVRPNKDGHVNMALPEDDYVMLIGKKIGKDKLFPEEPLALKNGKMLELKLHY